MGSGYYVLYIEDSGFYTKQFNSSAERERWLRDFLLTNQLEECCEILSLFSGEMTFKSSSFIDEEEEPTGLTTETVSFTGYTNDSIADGNVKADNGGNL